MEIKPAHKENLLAIVYLVRECVKDMNARNLFHWNNYYPGYQTLLSDAEAGNLFIGIEKGIVVATMSLDEEKPEEYIKEGFNGNGKTLYLHRLAVLPSEQGKGHASEMIAFAENYAVENGFNSIMLDVFEGNTNALDMYVNKGYAKKGSFLFPFQKTSFSCLSKEL